MRKIEISSYHTADFFFNHIRYNNPQDVFYHTHDICELIFLKKGALSYLVEGKTYQLSKYFLIVSRPGENHAIKFTPGSEYERYDILVDETTLCSHIYNLIPPDVSVINFDGNTLILDLFQKMDYYCENFEGTLLKNILLHLTEEVIYNVALAAKNTDQRGMYTVNPTIKKAVAYIERNITAPISVDSLCQELYVTKSHLHQLFTRHLKISPKKYITSKKLMLAQRELRTGKKPTEVYLTCGFSDYSTFYRDYIKQFGHSPSEEIHTKIVRKILS